MISSLTPSPEGCHPDPNNAGAFYCNFDRQEQQLVSIAVQIDYVLLVVLFFRLVIALLSIATGKSAVVTRRPPRSETSAR